MAEEAALLVEALRDLMATHTHEAPDEPPQPAAGEEPASGALPGQAAACALCPLCRLIAALGITRPEVVAHLVDAGTSLMAAFRAGLANPSASGSDGPPRTPVQRIDIS